MATQLRPYDQTRDFLAVRDLLIENYRATGRPDGWTIERWEYARHLVAHLRGHNPDESADAVNAWESQIRVWEQDGRVVAVLHCEEPWPGEAWIHRRPGFDDLLVEMIQEGEHTLARDGQLSFTVPNSDTALIDALWRRGYDMDRSWTQHVTQLPVDPLPECRLAAGHHIQSMADCDNIEPRRSVLSRGFGHPDPAEWVRADTYRFLMQAPDYDPNLDLYVVGPDGEYLSSCIVWPDRVNNIGMLEPVSTPPEHRRQGYAREVIYEAARRARGMGIRALLVGSANPLYVGIGFRVRATRNAWRKCLA